MTDHSRERNVPRTNNTFRAAVSWLIEARELVTNFDARSGLSEPLGRGAASGRQQSAIKRLSKAAKSGHSGIRYVPETAINADVAVASSRREDSGLHGLRGSSETKSGLSSDLRRFQRISYNHPSRHGFCRSRAWLSVGLFIPMPSG